MNPQNPKPPPKKPLKPDYKGATPKQVSEAILRHWVAPSPKPENKRWL